MDETSSVYCFLSRIYRILIAILAPLCFLVATFLLVVIFLQTDFEIMNLLPIGVEYIQYGDLGRAEFYILGFALTSIILSYQFIHIFLPKFSNKKSFILLLLYYLWIALSLIALRVSVIT